MLTFISNKTGRETWLLLHSNYVHSGHGITITMKRSKAIAGYHMLMILSSVDEHFNAKEDKIIRKFLVDFMPDQVNLDNETAIINSLSPEDYPIHFNNAMNDFYLDSTMDERNHFLDLAVRLVIADKNISPRENLYINELFNAWDANQM